MNRKILLTGGMGYIGSHVAVRLIEEGYEPIIVDNLSNSYKSVLDGIKEITKTKPAFYECDIRNKQTLCRIIQAEKPEAVIHLAGSKSVGESVENPFKYYDNNLSGFLSLLSGMRIFDVEKIIFSSSATVYGEKLMIPYKETMRPIKQTSPYAKSKFMIEQMLEDESKANPNFSSVCLRYFNPLGAHLSGLIGENPKGTPNNLMPYILKAAAKESPSLKVFGNDYDTKDGTCVRDYVHVMDIAQGHIDALKYSKSHKGHQIINLGSGKGYSVLDVIQSFEKANKIKTPYEIARRREGDLPEYYADIQKAADVLNWHPIYGMFHMCRDAWNYKKIYLKKY